MALLSTPPFRLGGLHLPFSRRSTLPSCFRSPPSLFLEGSPSQLLGWVVSPPLFFGGLTSSCWLLGLSPPPTFLVGRSPLSLLAGRSLFTFLVGRSPFSLFGGKKRKKKKRKKKRKKKKEKRKTKEEKRELLSKVADSPSFQRAKTQKNHGTRHSLTNMCLLLDVAQTMGGTLSRQQQLALSTVSKSNFFVVAEYVAV